MKEKVIYLDYHATTPVDPRVMEAMLPCFTAEFGNAASSDHSFGWEAHAKVDKGRAQIAALIHADPKEIIFTSGATESNNLAIKGAVESYGEKGGHIITQATEHKSVLDTFKYLKERGIQITVLGVDKHGRINPEELRKAITDKTILVSIMFANNEIGTIQPIEEIGKITRERKVLLHVDAAQAAGRIPIDVEKLHIDLLSLSAHKIYGPKGIGVLYVRRKNPHVRIAPLMHGGGHEEGLRSGTLNVPCIVGFGRACEIAAAELGQEVRRSSMLRDRLLQGITTGVGEVIVNGHPTEKLCNNLHVSFPGADPESLLMTLNERLAVSAGSACSSGIAEPSHVTKAIGLKPELMHTSVRFSVGRFTTLEDVEEAIHHVVAVVKRMRQFAPKSDRT